MSGRCREGTAYGTDRCSPVPERASRRPAAQEAALCRVPERAAPPAGAGGGAPRCLDCVDLGHLVFLARGDTALTRRSREGSTLSAVVLRFNRRRGRYERQGVLVEEAALARAEERCLADAEARRRRRARDARRREAEDVRFTDAFAREIQPAVSALSGRPGASDRRTRLGARQRAGRAELGGPRAVRGGGDRGGPRVRTAHGDPVRPVADERRSAARGAPPDRGHGGHEALGMARGHHRSGVSGQSPGAARA